MPFPVDGIAFDVGNTLITDPFDRVLKMKAFELKRAFSQAGYTFSAGEITDAWSEANKRVNYPFISHFYQEPGILRYCMDLLKVSGHERQDVITQLIIIYRSGLKPVITTDRQIKGVKKAIAELGAMGKRLIVFGNGRQRDTELCLSWTGLRSHFGTVTSSEKLGIEKPDPRVFSYILKALGTDPGRSMYVGDEPLNDICPAKRAGMLAIQFITKDHVSTPWRNYSPKKGCRPDAVIDSIGKLPEIIR
ncbi:MAG: HAD family hydrolase [Candidatus Aenigmarchaeota archaeon]|nr:HAD family hydrolase [Candidatus Aenigmarchaeota archaeon]